MAPLSSSSPMTWISHTPSPAGRWCAATGNWPSTVRWRNCSPPAPIWRHLVWSVRRPRIFAEPSPPASRPKEDIMSGDLTLGYVAGQSFLHRLDPLTKLIALAGVIIFAIGAPIDYNFFMLLGLLA